MAALALSLSSCFPIFVERQTDTVRPTPVTTNPNPRPVVVSGPIARSGIIQEFQSSRGNGGTYRVGEDVFFRLVVKQSGYVTLVIYNENDWQPIQLPSVFVQANVLNLVPSPGTVSAAEPLGVTRVRAFFTPQSGGSFSFSATYSAGNFQASSLTYLNPYPSNNRDYEDTFVFVTR